MLPTCFENAPSDAIDWIDRLLAMGFSVQTAVHEAIRGGVAISEWIGVDESANEDSFRLDEIADAAVHQAMVTLPRGGEQVRLIGEGVGGIFTPPGAQRIHASHVVIVDPVDGTRMLMHNKRSAWFLAGVALEQGESTSLVDIFAAVMVELPTAHQVCGEAIVAARGHGARRFRTDIGGQNPLELDVKPNQARDLRMGFAQVVNYFFPGPQQLAAELMVRIGAAASGEVVKGRSLVFHDQYISTGGMLAELIRGIDRLTVDLRPPLQAATRQFSAGLCCHPYDIAAAALVAGEAGVVVTDGFGNPLHAPLSPNDFPIHWIGYANKTLQAKIQPVIERFLAEHGISPGESHDRVFWPR